MGHKFIGRTARGRVIIEDSLDECIDSLAFVMNKDPAIIWVAETSERAWVVLPSKESSTADAWIATIEKVGP